MKLLSPGKIGNVSLNNRMVMAAMTRSRATADGVPTDLMAAYYAQRAAAGLIISEAINISPDAVGSPLTPSIYTDEQIAAWQKSRRRYTPKAAKSSPNFGTQGASPIPPTAKANCPSPRLP